MENIGVKFEEDFFMRNNRNITSSPDIALTELVANAWDAGAMKVNIQVPENDEIQLIIEDNGCGMSSDEFAERWMTLNYNRTKHQGRYVEFPPSGKESHNIKRVAYGRNGVGRHGMLCFADRYTVCTWKNGTANEYVIAVTNGNEPFKIVSHSEYNKDGHGTIIKSYVTRNKPAIEKIKEILAARFIYDPQFELVINGVKVNLMSCDGFLKEDVITTEQKKHLKVSIIDSSKTSITSHQHGVAFWVCGRLVGSPAWSYGKYQFLDARYRVAKRYTIIVQTDDIIDDVMPDWTGFFDTDIMNGVYSAVKKVVTELVSSVMKEQMTEVKNELIEQRRDELQELCLSEKREVSSFIDIVTESNPMLAPEVLKTSVDALMTIQKAKKGEELLAQLCNMSTEQIDKLSDLLKTWDINDIVNVIDEIDKRVLVVEAIGRIYESKTTDELHTLHPMVLQAKWLFGAEFDSPMFTSNKALSTVIKTLFKENEYDVNEVANPRKRPDIVCLNRGTMRAICTERADEEAGGVMKPDQILIIELKKGGFEVTGKEVYQAEDYVRQIRKSGQLHQAASIHAFVVGSVIGDIDTHRNTDSGVIDVVSYGQLVETASIKLFGLKEKLEEHYKTFDDYSLVEKALSEPSQMAFKF